MKRSSICDEKRESIMTLLLAIIGCLLNLSHAAVYAPSGGPVYVNPASTPSVAVALSPDHPDGGDLLTQTVYGFLDFTTTIGNTVMVFSPQSAPPDGGAATKPNTATNSVIETRPVASTSVEIKPSKTTVKKSDTQQQHKALKATVVLSSVVQVKTGSVATAVVEPPSVFSVVEVLSSKVEVREGPVSVSKVTKAHTTVKAEGVSSVVQVKTGQASSRVEVHTVTSIVSSIVQVHTKDSPVLSSRLQGDTSPPAILSTVDPVQAIVSSIVQVRTSNEEPAISGNNIALEPEYDFLSRQPSEVVDETYKVFNLKPSARFPKTRTSKPPSDSLHPTGLVTKLGGTVVKDGVTTVHETKVLGTFISGKYAQVLESTSHVFQHGNHKPKPTPASSLRILKTASPHKIKSAPALEPTPAGSLHEETVALPLEALFSSAPTSNHVRPSRRLATSSPRNNSFQSRFRGRHNKDTQENREQELDEDEEEEVAIVSRKSSPARNVRPTATAQRHKPTPKNSRFGRTSTSNPELATVSVFSDPVSSRRYQQTSIRSRNFRPTGTTSTAPEAPSYTRRGYKPRVQASSADSSSGSTSLYKFKLARPPGRWQYKTTPKPRIAIRKPDEPETPTPQPEAKSRSDELEQQQQQQDQPITDQEVTQAEGPELDVDDQPVVAETIKVEISTPADFKDVYYEIATIKSPYTFQVGTVKNTRYITVTSTYEKNLELMEASISPSSTEPLTENILATTLDSHIPLDSSVATLPPIGLANDVETPPLETLTETFSTTQLLLKTHLLPVVRDGTNTSTLTLVQSYHVTRMVTAIKTLPPVELYHFIPSRTLNEFNTRLEEAGSELHLELHFGEETNDEIEDLATVEKHFDLEQVEKGKVAEVPTPRPMLLLPEPPTTPGLSPEQLALLRFLNPAAIPSIITTSRPVLRIETIYESHVLPVVNGLATTFSTISRPVGTVSKTEYEYGTSTLVTNPINPLFPQHQQHPQHLQQQFAVTSTPVVTQTVVTATESKVLKLTFGAKTAYTTLFSTRVVPTLLTTYLTASVPVQPTAPAFHGYYPQPYPQFPFVG